MLRSGCMGRRRETLLWVVRRPAAAPGPRPRAFQVICMRTGPTQAARTPGGCVCEDLSRPGLLAHDLCRKCPHQIGHNSVHTQWIRVARHAVDSCIPGPSNGVFETRMHIVLGGRADACRWARAPCAPMHAHHADLKTPPSPSDHGFYTYLDRMFFIFFHFGPGPLRPSARARAPHDPQRSTSILHVLRSLSPGARARGGRPPGLLGVAAWE
jgi:hypothetical protein